MLKRFRNDTAIATTTAATLANGGTSVQLASVEGIYVGNVLLIDDGTTEVTVTLTSVNAGTSVVGFSAVTLGDTIASGAAVTRTAASDLLSMNVNASTANGPFSFKLRPDAGTEGLVKGLQIWAVDPATDLATFCGLTLTTGLIFKHEKQHEGGTVKTLETLFDGQVFKTGFDFLRFGTVEVNNPDGAVQAWVIHLPLDLTLHDAADEDEFISVSLADDFSALTGLEMLGDLV